MSSIAKKILKNEVHDSLRDESKEVNLDPPTGFKFRNIFSLFTLKKDDLCLEEWRRIETKKTRVHQNYQRWM